MRCASSSDVKSLFFETKYKNLENFKNKREVCTKRCNPSFKMKLKYASFAIYIKRVICLKIMKIICIYRIKIKIFNLLIYIQRINTNLFIRNQFWSDICEVEICFRQLFDLEKWREVIKYSCNKRIDIHDKCIHNFRSTIFSRR